MALPRRIRKLTLTVEQKLADRRDILRLTLYQSLREVLDYDGPVVCDVNCHEYHTYEPKIIGWETPIEDMYPYIPRDEFIENMSIEPLDCWKAPFQPDIK